MGEARVRQLAPRNTPLPLADIEVYMTTKQRIEELETLREQAL